MSKYFLLPGYENKLQQPLLWNYYIFVQKISSQNILVKF